MSFGTVLRTLLEDRDISQRQLAEYLNMAPSSIGSYVRDFREPDFHTLIRIADFFSVSTDVLLEHTQNIPSEKDQQQAQQIISALSADDRAIWLAQGEAILKLRQQRKA
ncbi:MAG: helix-turn-helix transcriptional regulator [Eubacteriales bacterium]|nr:helix-turn-helix transcriptional regulator [Eubacteriales bacterium]